MQIAPLVTMNSMGGSGFDPAGSLARGVQARETLDSRKQGREAKEKMQGILSQMGDSPDYEAAALQMLPLDPKMANSLLGMESQKQAGALNRQEMQMNAQVMAQNRIKQKQEQITREVRAASGAVEALEGVEEPDQKSRIYDLYLDSLERQEIDIPEDLKSGWSPENEQNLREIAELGQQMLALDPERYDTSQIKNFEYAQKDPEFEEFYQQSNQRDLSGTEAIVSQLRAEDPDLSYAGALSIAQGLARKAQTIKDGKVVPIEGAIQTTKDFKSAEKEGEKTGEAEGEALNSYKDIMAALPGLEKTAKDLYKLADLATYSVAGKAKDSFKRQFGFDPSEGAKARAKFEAIAKNDLFPQLKDMFGGNMATREVEMLLTTYGDPDLSPEEKKAQIDARVDGWVKEAEKRARRAGKEEPDNLFEGGNGLEELTTEELEAMLEAE